MDLTKRQADILRAVIIEHTSTVAPVPSETLVRKYGFPFSSATIRNEMAELERLGYITHPHTSAGRMPSDKGYRYFVEHLMEPSLIAEAEERMIRHQFHQVEMDMDQWVELAASVLAQFARSVAVVTEPKSQEARLKHFELLSIRDQTVLLVLVLQDGTIKQQILAMLEPVDQEDLSRISNKLNTLFCNFTRREIELDLADLTPSERSISMHLVDAMRMVDEQTAVKVHHDGLANMLSQPEFRHAEDVQKVLETLERGTAISTLMPYVLQSSGVHVIIGSENSVDELRECSIVIARYGLSGEVLGILGVLGPTRMEYGRSISTVRYMSGLMTGLLNELYGTDRMDNRNLVDPGK